MCLPELFFASGMICILYWKSNEILSSVTGKKYPDLSDPISKTSEIGTTLLNFARSMLKEEHICHKCFVKPGYWHLFFLALIPMNPVVYIADLKIKSLHKPASLPSPPGILINMDLLLKLYHIKNNYISITLAPSPFPAMCPLNSVHI